ncbi:hypothetical protein [Methanobacterium sp. SMA-27]|uniref:hypothetical protein n=1 Tax=Methanobacterium sp. SMA-27 TaxID=1495336 RepID=UPI00064EFDFB|nr:hypothetical protein [Methanobacterium sp. SMA-27]
MALVKRFVYQVKSKSTIKNLYGIIISPVFSVMPALTYCPEQSIQIKSTMFLKSFTDKNGRYFNPNTTVEDIASQKLI